MVLTVSQNRGGRHAMQLHDAPSLILAGASFIGRHLAARLRSADVPFRATSRTPQPNLLPCDLTRQTDIEAILQTLRPRTIYQCAGVTAASTESELFRLHQHAAEVLLRAVARVVPEAVVVFLGSAAEYGPVPPERLPIDEDALAAPHSAYGRSKLAQTETAARLAAALNLRVHVVRPFNVLGAGLGPQYFAASFLERLKAAKEIGPMPVANAHATRDWIDVNDVADALFRLGEQAPPRPGAMGLFNVATGVETSVLDVANELCRLAGGFHAVDEGRAASRSGVDRSAGAAARLRAATGWRPTKSWRDSLRDMWADSEAKR
jgi:nucleoside-diphosphate-sugar epimerase